MTHLYALVEASLAAATARESDAHDAEIAAALTALLQPGQGEALAQVFAHAPSAAVYRHLWRFLARCERAGAPDPSQIVRLFAMPVVIVAGIEQTANGSAVLDGVIDDPAALASLMKEHGALGGNQTLSFASSLVAADALDFARLPHLFANRDRGGDHPLPPAPIDVTKGHETVHLRFLLGTALAAAGANLFRDDDVRRYGVPLARALSKALAPPNVSVLALPRAPLPLVEAQWQGRVAQREVAAQIFASNAIRRIRAATGEPSAVIGVHEDEVRLSLSSPFDADLTEEFHCRLWPLDRVDDVIEKLATLLADCRVSDVTQLRGQSRATPIRAA